MIATGGLLRINARRQGSLKSKPHKAQTKKKNKSKNKRRSEVVVVKGKVKLCSVSGLVAVLGILVLLGGIFMAALGYWPRDGLFFSAREGAAMASVSSSRTTPPPAGIQGGEEEEEHEGDGEIHKGDEGINNEDKGGEGEEGIDRDGDERGLDNDGFNQTETIDEKSQELARGFVADFLDRYLHSDRLKVFGPLIMGIGIFLFICANAVLHENRDKKTKVINLRDIYSTVIDLHSLRKPTTTSSCPSSANPLNGLINYVQSKSLETKSRAFPPSLLSRREGGDRGGGQPGSSRAGGGDEGGDAVFSIYQEQTDAPPPPLPPSSYDRHSLPRSFSSSCWTSQQKEALCSFTLPLRCSRPASTCRRHSVWGAIGREEELKKTGGRHCSPPPSPPPCSSTPPPSAPEGSQALLLLSSSSLTHLSHSSLSHLLSSSASTPAPPCRRRSLPTVISSAGYSKLTHREEDSFEWSSSQGGAQRSEEVTSQSRGTNGEA